jgi:hypothetical protein
MPTHTGRWTVRTAGACALLLLGFPPRTAAQDPRAPPTETLLRSTEDHPKGGAGVLKLLPGSGATAVLSNLRQDRPNWPEALRTLFGGTYDRKLLDWIVFIDTLNGRQPVKQALVQDNLEVEDVRGHRFVWVLVISSTDLSGDDDVIISRRTVDYQREASLGALFKALARAAPADPATSSLADSVSRLPLWSVVEPADSGEHRLYVALQRFALRYNASIVLSVRPAKSGTIPHTQAVYRTFTNASANRFDAGLALGVTHNAPDTTSATDGSIDRTSTATRWNVYLTATVLAKRPMLPLRSFSFGAAVGTNIATGDIFRDLIVAAYVGRLPGEVGFLGGINYIAREARQPINTATVRRREYRVVKLFLGVHVAL